MSGASGAGGAIGAIGSLVSGQSQADVLRNQASIQRNNATQAIVASKQNADRQVLISDKQIGSEKEQFAANGVAADSGSVLNVLAASSANAELDRQTILYGGQVRAINYENQASIDSLSADNALTASYYGAAGSAIKGATPYLASAATDGPGEQ